MSADYSVSRGHLRRLWLRAGLFGLPMLGVVLMMFGVVPVMADLSEPATVDSNLGALQRAPAAIERINYSSPDKPQWYRNQLAAEQSAATEPVPGVTVANQQFTYTVSTRGVVKSSRDSFAALASKTLNDGRGWARVGLSFREVSSDGDFNLILSQASLLPTFSSACSADWSCRVGASVIVNDDRWQGGTSAWYGSGGSLSDYRHYVVNHEVGHWLGHGHYGCGGAGQKAPVMLQQSIDLQGCVPNPWPIESELWTSR